jgi:hypothetical protein
VRAQTPPARPATGIRLKPEGQTQLPLLTVPPSQRMSSGTRGGSGARVTMSARQRPLAAFGCVPAGHMHWSIEFRKPPSRQGVATTAGAGWASAGGAGGAAAGGVSRRWGPAVAGPPAPAWRRIGRCETLATGSSHRRSPRTIAKTQDTTSKISNKSKLRSRTRCGSCQNPVANPRTGRKANTAC